ncbi:MAG: hypothetical protein U0271_08625 [Polyangiaceae bacterium]
MTRPRSLLDGFFFPASALDVLRARASLTDPAADDADRSHGAVTSSGFLERRGGEFVAQPAGLACERIFGPLVDLACRCGKLRGAAHAGTICEKCGVLCGSSALRDTRFAHLALPGGVVHPALAPAIGAVVGISAEDVLAVARNEAWLDGARVIAFDSDDWTEHSDACGVATLRERLARGDRARLPADLAAAGFSPTALLIDALPVVPPGDRPLLRLDDPTIVALQPGPINQALRDLTTRSHRLARLLELHATSLLVQNEEQLLQAAFDRVYDAVLRGAGFAPSALSDPPIRGTVAPSAKWNEGPPHELRLAVRTPIAIDGERWYPYPDGPPEPTTPRGCLWLDDERLLLQFPYAVVIVSRADGRVLAEHAVFGLAARSVPGRVVFLGDHPTDTVDEDGIVLVDVAVLDTLEGRWAARYPADLRAVTVVNDQPEDAFLYDFRTGSTLALDLACDRPGLLAISRDHRFVWAGGSSATGVIVSADTGIVHLEVEELDPEEGPFLLLNGKLVEELPDELELEEDGAAAFALSPAGCWRVLSPEGALCEGERRLCTLAFPRLAAAFDASGDHLVVLTSRGALIVEVAETPRIAQRIDLKPLARLLAPPARAKLTPAVRDALLQRIGTMSHLDEVPLELLADLGIDAKTARTLRKTLDARSKE